MGILKQWSSEARLSPEVHEKLSQFLDLLVEWNRRINLTGYKTREEMEELLVGESLLAAEILPLSGKSVLDVGSGAGIPGLIWATYDPTIRLTSVEAREKKVAFQKEAIRTLSIHAEVWKGIFPQIVEGRTFDLVTTRAVRFKKTFERQAGGVLSTGGMLVGFGKAGVDYPSWESQRLSLRTLLLTRYL